MHSDPLSVVSHPFFFHLCHSRNPVLDEISEARLLQQWCLQKAYASSSCLRRCALLFSSFRHSILFLCRFLLLQFLMFPFTIHLHYHLFSPIFLFPCSKFQVITGLLQISTGKRSGFCRISSPAFSNAWFVYYAYLYFNCFHFLFPSLLLDDGEEFSSCDNFKCS